MMLTIAPVLRKPAAPIRETRVAPRPHIRMEQAGPSCPIDQRALPQINGVGLEAHELSRVNRARNRAMSLYLLDCTPSDLDLAESVGRAAAKAELILVLRDRTAKAKRDAPCELMPIRVRIGQRQMRWDAGAMGWDAYEKNSGLVGHEG